MFNTVKRIAVGLAALSISVGAFAQSDRAMDLDALLKQLEEGQFAQSEQNKQRERDFQAQRAEQDRILRETREKRDPAGPSIQRHTARSHVRNASKCQS